VVVRSGYAIYRYRLLLVAAIIGGGASLAIAQGKSSTSVSQAALGAEAPFPTENNAAMQTMMANMTVKPTGDVDRDFVAMMTPHHQGAIDMAQAELQYGHNPLLARVAQGIIVEQLQEIAAMRLALGESASPTWVTDSPAIALKAQPVSDDSVKAESPYLAQNNVAMTTMMTNMTVKPSGDIDHDFVAMMVQHHQGGIDMARAELRYGHNPQLMRVAQEIVVDQIQEISPYSAATPDIPISSHDRVYTEDQFSNTVSVVDPETNTTLGVIPLGDPSPANFSPLYKGQVLVHGMGFSSDHHTIGVVSIGSNSVTFIDTATNTVKHTTYVGRLCGPGAARGVLDAGR
jgi:YVTN family beta-propeller protein